MRLVPVRWRSFWLLAAWVGAVGVGLQLAVEPCLRWALQNGAWQAPEPTAETFSAEDTTTGGEEPGAEAFWNVPLADSPEPWQRWRKRQWQRLRELPAEQQLQQVTALLELLESPGVQLSQPARHEVARLLEQIYNHLAADAPGRRWPWLARIQQRRQALLDRTGDAASVAEAAHGALREPKESSARPSLPGTSEVPVLSRRAARKDRSPDVRSALQGSDGRQNARSAPVPGRLPRAVANQARRLSVQGTAVEEEGLPAPERLSRPGPRSQDEAPFPSPPEMLPLGKSVGKQAPASQSLWQLWHQWRRASDAQRKQALWERIAALKLSREVKEALFHLGGGSPQLRADALERLAAHLGAGAAPWLWWAAESPEERVRFTALSLLAAGNDPVQLRRVYRTALGDESPRVRRLARQIEPRLR